MKTILITNINNETVEITSNDKKLFLEIATFDGNIDKCEVHTKSEGWFYLLNALESIEGNIDITNFDEDILINYFENHLFANEFHGN